MILFYFYFKRFTVYINGLSDDKVLSLTKKEYGATAHFLEIFIKYLKSILMNDLMQFVEVLFSFEFT